MEPKAGVHQCLANKEVTCPRKSQDVHKRGGFGGKPVHSAWGSVVSGVNGTPRWECLADPEVKPGSVSSRSIPGSFLSLHLLVRPVTWCCGTHLLTSQRGPQPASHGRRPRPSRRLPPAPRRAPSSPGSLGARGTREARRRCPLRMKWNCSRGVQRGAGTGLNFGAGSIFILFPPDRREEEAVGSQNASVAGAPDPLALRHPQRGAGAHGEMKGSWGLSGRPSASVWGPGDHLLV